MGKLIGIEGTDFSFKATQSKMLYDYIVANVSKNCQLITYPKYDSPSSYFVKQMLSGKYEENAGDIDPVVASIFYAVDRFDDYTINWKSTFDKEDGFVISDRYSGSNIIHQSTKILDMKKRMEMAQWILDLEHIRFGIPLPNLTIFISVDPEVVVELKNKERENNLKGNLDRDIHELDPLYQIECHRRSLEICSLLGWKVVNGCDNNGQLRTREEIHNDIIQIMKGELLCRK